MAKQTIQALFEKIAYDFPNRIATSDNNQTLTYGQLNQKANQLAHYLQKFNLKPDTAVALFLERSFDFLVTILAILKAGCAYLPIDSSQPEERLAYILQDSQAPILITTSVFKNKLRFYQKKIILLDHDAEHINKKSMSNPTLMNNSEDLAYIIYTSGSTGTPKGVLIEHRSVINYAQWFANYAQCKPRQRIDFSGSLIFDMSITTTIIPLMLGLTVVICNEVVKKDISCYLRYLAESKVHIIKLTPSYFKVLLQEAKNNFIDLSQLSSIILGGENLSSSLCQAWLKLYPKHTLFNEYGPTETTVAVSSYKITHQNSARLNTFVPIGTLGTHMSSELLDINSCSVREGEVGELFIAGVCLARGYLNQPQLTEQQFIIRHGTRFYKTGDLCKRLDGVLEYLGRIDEQVKIRGYRIELKEIEKHLIAHPEIKEVSILAQKDSFDEPRLLAYYIPKDSNKAFNKNQLRLYLRKHLPDYMIPSLFIAVDFFPLTANGKLDKAALPLPALTISAYYVEPTTVLERKLKQIWSEELGVPLIGIYDDFFDLGGHSLSAARIISKINNQLKRDLSLQEFYEAGHIAQLTSVMKHSKKTKEKHRNSNFYKTHIPLSDFQFLLWMSNSFEPKAQKLNIVGRKRFQGRLNKQDLEYAFQAIFKKHEALSFRILKLQPEQKIQKNRSFKLMIHHLDSGSHAENELELQKSMTQLIHFYPWPKKAPFIIGKLFYLPKGESELQVCIPHLISDDYCMDILFSELSLFYQRYDQLTFNDIETDTHFKEHILIEQKAMKTQLKKDILFWEDYLKDSSLFSFPEHYVVYNMESEHLPYSTYKVISKATLNHLKNFCEQNHISMNNALCAIIALALRNCCGNYKSTTLYTYMNIIQSTRDNPIYDNTIGCFLRVEPIKIILNNEANLIRLSQQIRQSIIETSSHQFSSNLVKLSSISSFKPNTMERLFTNLLSHFFTRFFKIPPVYRKILKRCASRIISFKRHTQFLINLNIRGNFLADSTDNLMLFGFNTQPIQSNNDDLLAIDNIFEASFIRDDNQNTRYLVISANLKPQFRELIAEEVIRIIDSLRFEERIPELKSNTQTVI